MISVLPGWSLFCSFFVWVVGLARLNLGCLVWLLEFGLLVWLVGFGWLSMAVDLARLFDSKMWVAGWASVGLLAWYSVI